MFTTTYPFKICDSIHGFIRFDETEKKVIDSRPFQRLRYIRQMGVSYLTYPGATHTRFEHSLGVMELVSRCYDSLLRRHHLKIQESSYWRRILRIAALCHDMGHLPFSHTAEKSLLPDGGHEEMTVSMIRSPEMREIWKEIVSPGRNVEDDIIKLTVSVEELRRIAPHLTLTPLERVLSQVITEDNFGADRIDYLIRDTQATGVGYGHFDYHQLIDTLRVLPDPKDPNLLALGVSESGVQSVESLWIARYLMYARVYHHTKSRIYAFHMDRFMKRLYENRFRDNDVEWYLHQCDYHILAEMREWATQGDFDAKALLKEGPSFEDLSKEVKNEELFVLLQSKFGDGIYLDFAPEREERRDFPVVTREGQVISSTEESQFLRDIPYGSKAFSLFVHPEQVASVREFLQTRETKALA